MKVNLKSSWRKFEGEINVQENQLNRKLKKKKKGPINTFPKLMNNSKISILMVVLIFVIINQPDQQVLNWNYVLVLIPTTSLLLLLVSVSNTQTSRVCLSSWSSVLMPLRTFWATWEGLWGARVSNYRSAGGNMNLWHPLLSVCPPCEVFWRESELWRKGLDTWQSLRQRIIRPKHTDPRSCVWKILHTCYLSEARADPGLVEGNTWCR